MTQLSCVFEKKKHIYMVLEPKLGSVHKTRVQTLEGLLVLAQHIIQHVTLSYF